MKRKLAYIFFGTIIFLLGFTSKINAQEKVRLNLFWSIGCPHCKAEKAFLEELLGEYEWLEVASFEISQNPKNGKLFAQVASELSTTAASVPFSVVCDEYFVGYSDTEAYKQMLRDILLSAREERCPDLVSGLYSGDVQLLSAKSNVEAKESQDLTAKRQGVNLPESVKVPIIGELRIKELSLPVLTFVIALLDGFNPCAMWVLLFLISLLLGMNDKLKMWTLGSVFILTSGLIYFLFLSAWLNLFLFVGYIGWVRALIGIFALGAGAYYLRDYQINKAGACKVGDAEKKKKVFDRLKKITQNKSFLLAVVGIILLAIAVNVVELICSAGLPAIYTQVLAITPMARWQYYLYLAFYILIFMLDDLIVFILAITTLNAVGIGGKYSRFSHLVGGVIMLIIGVLLLLKPEVLMFG